jgi:hypothetical protein
MANTLNGAIPKPVLHTKLEAFTGEHPDRRTKLGTRDNHSQPDQCRLAAECGVT